MKDSVQYSKELIDKFKAFYDKFNILSDEVLINKAYQNQQNNNIRSNERKKIIIDNMAAKELDQIINNDIDKLERSTKENDDTLKKLNGEIGVVKSKIYTFLKKNN